MRLLVVAVDPRMVLTALHDLPKKHPRNLCYPCLARMVHLQNCLLRGGNFSFVYCVPKAGLAEMVLPSLLSLLTALLYQLLYGSTAGAVHLTFAGKKLEHFGVNRVFGWNPAIVAPTCWRVNPIRVLQNFNRRLA